MIVLSQLCDGYWKEKIQTGKNYETETWENFSETNKMLDITEIE